ncbi:MAG: hypothetical protein AAGE18_15055 [Pseudomonadota bacterium]
MASDTPSDDALPSARRYEGPVWGRLPGRRPARVQPAEAAAPSTADLANHRLAKPVLFFLITLIIPFIISLGPLRLSVYRIILLVMIVPMLVAWLSGKAGRIRLPDIFFLLLCAWAALSFAIVHGPQVAIEGGGIFFIETMGAYLLARCYIRTAEDFRKMTIVLFSIVLFLLPFAIVEAVTGRNVLLDFFDSVMRSYGRVMKDPRWGLNRVQATFEHPILFGVFCGSAIALAYMVVGYGRSFFARAWRALAVLFTAALCLSSGPLTGMVAQFLLIGWNGALSAFKARWTLLVGLVVSALVALEIVANRSAPAIFISYFSFNEFSAYMRIHIWNFGTASIWNHPFIGIGLNEWERPFWMSPSIDMFWIVFGVRHGLPAQLFMLGGFLSVFLSLSFLRCPDPRLSAYRLAILICLTGLFLTGWTVHYWNATYALFMFLIGSGVWLLDTAPEDEPARGRRR